MDSIDKLTEIFKEFPGIGERQARRFVYFLMFRNGEYANNLSRMILELKKEVSQCKECYQFFLGKENKSTLCDICGNPNTDPTMLMVIEKDSDLESVRKSKVYGGKYFILGGLVPIVEKTTKSRVRIEELKQKISNQKDLQEVILAFSLNPQGEHTDQYVREQIKDICDTKNIKISSLGRGLSTGTELEYSDNETLKNALRNRQ
ncbi:MAG: recombination protein RecR [Candidatus Pacebacteria bacterium]|nr:recombination protein RecR [Candidatus Paceibacterota bacterium]